MNLNCQRTGSPLLLPMYKQMFIDYMWQANARGHCWVIISGRQALPLPPLCTMGWQMGFVMNSCVLVLKSCLTMEECERWQPFPVHNVLSLKSRVIQANGFFLKKIKKSCCDPNERHMFDFSFRLSFWHFVNFSRARACAGIPNFPASCLAGEEAT